MVPSRTSGDEQAERRIAEVAQRRAGGWAVLARQLGASQASELAPDDLQHLRAAVGWRGRERERFGLLLDALREAVQAAPLQELLAPDPIRQLADGMRTMAALCSDESEAWQRGDVDAARRLRREQHGFLKEHVAPDLGRTPADRTVLLSPYAELLAFASAFASSEAGPV